MKGALYLKFAYCKRFTQIILESIKSLKAQCSGAINHESFGNKIRHLSTVGNSLCVITSGSKLI